MHRSRFLACAAACCGVLALPLVPSPARAERGLLRLEAGGGFGAPFGAEPRSVLGAHSRTQIGAALQVTDTAEIFLDAGWARSSGHELAVDPTFDQAPSTWDMFPVTFGFRGGPRPVTSPGRDVRVLLGAGWQTCFVAYRPEFGEVRHEPTQGLVLELRPEVRVGPWTVWAAERVTLVATVAYADVPVREINTSGTSLQLGVSYRLGVFGSPRTGGAS